MASFDRSQHTSAWLWVCQVSSDAGVDPSARLTEGFDASGLGIGIGPTFGGLLVEHYWWGSSLMLAGSIAVAALLATTMFVPDSRDPSTPPTVEGRSKVGGPSTNL